MYLFLNAENFKCGLFERINRGIRHNLSQNRGILNTPAENIARNENVERNWPRWVGGKRLTEKYEFDNPSH